MQIRKRLDSLTSLRFFAAVMIVVHHSVGLFGLDKNHPPFLLWGQGVSFFFVLSGFILAYVYPRLDTWQETKQFWRSRIARIWPSLIVTFFLAYFLLQLKWDTKTACTNIFMVNAWIPLPKYFFSYNSPSWSISTEFFFYLAFPLLIWRWDKTWLLKLICAGLVVFFLCIASNYYNLQSYSSVDDGVTRTALLYINPLSRIFEFIFGMLVASCWRRNAELIRWSKIRASLYEISVVIMAICSMRFMPEMTKLVNQLSPGNAVAEWLIGSGSMFFFGLLIFVIAMERGIISKFLSHKSLVLLGEISFSLYLIHQILLRYYLINITLFPRLPNNITLVIFWIIALLSSYLMWIFIEIPGRQLILRKTQNDKYERNNLKISWYYHPNLNKKNLFAFTILTFFLSSVYFSMGNVNRVSAKEVNAITPTHYIDSIGSRFGDLFVLRGVDIIHDESGIHIKLAWESLCKQQLAYTNGIHLTDTDGKILVPADYRQPIMSFDAKRGMLWRDDIFIAADKLTGKEQKLAIALFPIGHAQHLLTVDKGDRDWGNRRLLIGLNRTD